MSHSSSSQCALHRSQSATVQAHCVRVYCRLPSKKAVNCVRQGSCRSCSTSSNYSTSSSSYSSNCSTWGRLPSVTSFGRTRELKRAGVVTWAWFGQQQTQRLWDYDGSSVKHMSLRELELLHRLSFGHRNQRSYLVVLYTPDSPACQAFEAEVERLASGLRHEPAFVAAALDVSSSEAATFASNMLKVEQVPAVLLYPEAARGCLKFLGPDMSALGMLAAVNKARSKALPATASSPGAAEWRLIEAAAPLTMTAFRAAAATGDTEVVVAALQQQMQPIQPTPLTVAQASSYWTAGKAQLWGGLLLCSVLFLAWDLKLSDLWEDWCLSRRQAARLQGRSFTPQENLDDIVTYMMKSLSGQQRQQMLSEHIGLQLADAAEVQQLPDYVRQREHQQLQQPEPQQNSKDSRQLRDSSTQGKPATASQQAQCSAVTGQAADG